MMTCNFSELGKTLKTPNTPEQLTMHTLEVNLLHSFMQTSRGAGSSTNIPSGNWYKIRDPGSSL
jgi:hypothetical protein